MKLFSVALHCVKVTWKGGVPKIAQGINVGPLVAESEEDVRKWAEVAVVRQFPAYKGWESHAYSFSEVLDAQIDAVRPVVELTAPEPVKTKQKRRTPRQEWTGDDDE